MEKLENGSVASGKSCVDARGVEGTVELKSHESAFSRAFGEEAIRPDG